MVLRYHIIVGSSIIQKGYFHRHEKQYAALLSVVPTRHYMMSFGNRQHPLFSHRHHGDKKHCWLLRHFGNRHCRLQSCHFGDTRRCLARALPGFVVCCTTTAIRSVMFSCTAMVIDSIVFSLTAMGVCGVVFCRATSVIGIVIFCHATLVIHNNQPKEGHAARMPATEAEQRATTIWCNKRTRGQCNMNMNASATTATRRWWQW